MIWNNKLGFPYRWSVLILSLPLVPARENHPQFRFIMSKANTFFDVPPSTSHAVTFYPIIPLLKSWTCQKKGIGFWSGDFKEQVNHFLACCEGLSASLKGYSFFRFVQDQLLSLHHTAFFSCAFLIVNMCFLRRCTVIKSSARTSFNTLLFSPAGNILQPSNLISASLLLCVQFLIIWKAVSAVEYHSPAMSS